METIQESLDLKPRRRIMHAASIKNSKQLQAIYFNLLDGEWHTSLALAQASGTLCIGTRIQELKAPINGYQIESRCKGRNENGCQVWEYRLVNQEVRHDS